MRRHAPWAIALAAGMTLAGCADDMSDLRDYTVQIKDRSGGEIEPLPEFERYESFTYRAENLRDPFIPARAFAEAQQQEESDDSGLSPDFDRPREPLERYPLDSLRMVGTLSRDATLWGLVRSPDGTVHQVLEGNYMGQNHGRIQEIRPDRIELVEIVRDGSDNWMEREAALGLGEGDGEDG